MIPSNALITPPLWLMKSACNMSRSQPDVTSRPCKNPKSTRGAWAREMRCSGSVWRCSCVFRCSYVLIPYNQYSAILLLPIKVSRDRVF